jgi:hypothetical protein
VVVGLILALLMCVSDRAVWCVNEYGALFVLEGLLHLYLATRYYRKTF